MYRKPCTRTATKKVTGMTSPHEQEKSHPLEQVTGEKDVHPEEEAQEQAVPGQDEEARDESLDDGDAAGSAP